MKPYSLLQIGTFHTTHCEDDLITAEVGPGRLLLAVMDGCTMGTDSHLPSTLCAKLLRKIARELDFAAFRERQAMDLRTLQRTILRRLFEELRFLQNYIQLEKAELLCTLVLALVDLETRSAEVIVVGDGWVDCNGAGTEFEQDNRPDYLGYHLHEDFEVWYAAQTQRLSLTDVRDLSIASDGILSFQQAVAGEFEAITVEGVVRALLRDTTGSDATTMLQARLKEIALRYGQKPTDDLAIVRVVLLCCPIKRKITCSSALPKDLLGGRRTIPLRLEYLPMLVRNLHGRSSARRLPLGWADERGKKDNLFVGPPQGFAWGPTNDSIACGITAIVGA